MNAEHYTDAAVSKVGDHNAYDLTPDGGRAFQDLGMNVDAVQMLRRRFALAC